MGDHTESIEITYDPKVISYDELLDIFWESHSPTSRPYSRQYMSMIMYNSNTQRRAAEASLKRWERKLGGSIQTVIQEAGKFTSAEDYHQKYYLKNNGVLMDDLRKFYRREADITNSTAAARLNGYIAGHGSLEELVEEIDSFGLSAEGKELLLRRVGPKEPGKFNSFVSSVLKACGIDLKS